MNDSDDNIPSKTQLKQEAHDVLSLVNHLLALTATELSEIPLSDTARQGLADAASITQRGARKRHLKWLAKQLRREEVAPIEAAYEQVLQARQNNTAAFHLAETWRDKLINEDDETLADFIAAYPLEEVQQFRQLVRKAQKEQLAQKNQGASRALFRTIRKVMS